MKIGLTELIFLNDNNAPASITDFDKQACRACNNFISTLAASGADIRVTFANYGNGYKLTHDDVTIKDVKLLIKDFESNGTRDIFDCVGFTMHEKGKKYSEISEDLHPENVIFILTAFGADNASKNYTFGNVADMISHQAEIYKWNFFCLTDESAIADKLGLTEDSVILTDTAHLNIHPNIEADVSSSLSQADFLTQALNELAELVKAIIFKQST